MHGRDVKHGGWNTMRSRPHSSIGQKTPIELVKASGQTWLSHDRIAGCIRKTEQECLGSLTLETAWNESEESGTVSPQSPNTSDCENGLGLACWSTVAYYGSGPVLALGSGSEIR